MIDLFQHPLKNLQFFYPEICLLSVSESGLWGKYQFWLLTEVRVSVQPSAMDLEEPTAYCVLFLLKELQGIFLGFAGFWLVTTADHLHQAKVSWLQNWLYLMIHGTVLLLFQHLVAKPQVYRWGLPSCCPLTPICLAYPAPRLTFTTRLFPPHSPWSHTGAGHPACPMDARLLRVSVFMSPVCPLLWKQVTGSIHVFQTRSHLSSALLVRS